ncbi:hypothetical protein DLJ53_31100 [Acuticoccus sediminis]|uniref:GAF domain-containing protein n=1 Tax=Acuticoccus sediminis TaxID=2184697 RepID=A0A8B2NHA6_9HYPH|nr:hypothetical protein DLJ53_31100 [Acuticoccus sediminis]
MDTRFGLGFCAELEEAPLDACYPEGSAFLDGGDPALERGIALLGQPLIHQEQTIGILYLESAPGRTVFTRQCVSLMSMPALRATVSFECALLVEALRETNSWMVRGQRIGRMGSHRWNTRTLLSRGSRECYRILDLDLNVNPVPFEAFRGRIHPDDLAMVTRGIEGAVRSRSPFSQRSTGSSTGTAPSSTSSPWGVDIGPSGDQRAATTCPFVTSLPNDRPRAVEVQSG